MYLVGIRYFDDNHIKHNSLYYRVMESMDEIMPYIKEKIRYLIVRSDASLEEGSFVMLDSADDKGKSFKYYQFDVNDCETKKPFCRFDIIELVPGSIITFW